MRIGIKLFNFTGKAIYPLLLGIFLFLLFPGKALSAGFTGDISLLTGGQYNDNIFLTKTGRVGDFITLVEPSLSLFLDSRPLTAKVSYSPKLSFYSSHSELNETGQGVSVEVNTRPAQKLSLVARDDFLRSNMIAEQILVPGIGPIRERSLLKNNLASISATISRIGRFEFVLTGSQLNSHIESSHSPSDLQTSTVAGSARYVASSRTDFFLTADSGWYGFENAPAARSQSYVAGVTHQITATMSSTLSGGVVFTEQGEITHNGFTGQLRITKRTERGSLSAVLSESVLAGVEDSEPLRARSASLVLSRNLSSPLTMNITGSASRYTSLDGAVVRQTVLSAATSLHYRLTSLFSVEVSYDFIDFKDDANSSNDFYNNIATVSFVVSYSKKLLNAASTIPKAP